MTAFENPHVAADLGGYAPPGTLPGCVHASCPVNGVTWQCVGCGLVATHSWPEIDKHAHAYLVAHGDGVLDSIPLPACPGCGALPFLNNADIVRGLDDPHHYTQRAIHEHILQRARLKGRFAVNRASQTDPLYQGTDFSHLPAHARPPEHRDPGE